MEIPRKERSDRNIFLSNKPTRFLIALTKPRKAPLEIGREIYTSNSSVYNALDEFEQLGLIELTKGKRDLRVKLTALGRQKLFHIHGLWDCTISPKHI